VIVVGLFPSFNSGEDSPRLHASLDDYVNWYTNRMTAEHRDRRQRPASSCHGVARLMRHHWAIERDYLDPVFGPHTLGRGAVYADAIPWKWNTNRDPELSDTAVLRYARGRIAEIASVLQPDVLLTIGAPTAAALGLEPPQVTPNVECGRIGYWAGQCLVLFHPDRPWTAGGRAVYRASVQQLLRDIFPI
jgi:hypothetical protein